MNTVIWGQNGEVATESTGAMLTISLKQTTIFSNISLPPNISIYALWCMKMLLRIMYKRNSRMLYRTACLFTLEEDNLKFVFGWSPRPSIKGTITCKISNTASLSRVGCVCEWKDALPLSCKHVRSVLFHYYSSPRLHRTPGSLGITCPRHPSVGSLNAPSQGCHYLQNLDVCFQAETSCRLLGLH